MRYLTSVQEPLRRHYGFGLFLAAAGCAVMLTAHASQAAPGTAPRTPADASGVDGGDAVGTRGGPTVKLNYDQKTFQENSIASFMYFVPLLSRTSVDRETSAENEQHVSIVSYRRELRGTSFHVACEFEIRGKGFHKNTFDPAGAIATRLLQQRDTEPMTSLLDYIMFEGEGFGHIEIDGTSDASGETVTRVNLRFNGRRHKSPVTIGLYDIEPKDGEYTYENRSNELVARVNTLTFTTSDTDPRMGVTVASIAKGPALDGFLARVKGPIANLLIKPPKIETLGNETMLRFGYAILKQEPDFTFPLAKNIRRSLRRGRDS